MDKASFSKTLLHCCVDSLLPGLSGPIPGFDRDLVQAFRESHAGVEGAGVGSVVRSVIHIEAHGGYRKILAGPQRIYGHRASRGGVRQGRPDLDVTKSI